MYCPQCGADVDNRTNYCPVCGRFLAPTPVGSYQAPIRRRSIAWAIVLSFLTLGIYGIYWLYRLVTDLNTAAYEPNGTGGGMVIFLSIITFGIYMIYWYYKAGGKVNRIRTMSGRPEDSSLGILYVILSLFGFSIVTWALIQDELNKVSAEV